MNSRLVSESSKYGSASAVGKSVISLPTFRRLTYLSLKRYMRVLKITQSHRTYCPRYFMSWQVSLILVMRIPRRNQTYTIRKPRFVDWISSRSSGIPFTRGLPRGEHGAPSEKCWFGFYDTVDVKRRWRSSMVWKSHCIHYVEQNVTEIKY